MDASDLPNTILASLNGLNTNLDIIENNFSNFHGRPLNEVESKMTSLEKAKSELVAAYTVNSLFWMYLRINGHDVSKHPVNQELDRVRKSMARVKEIEDKCLAPKLDLDASRRFLRNALWEKAHSKKPKVDADTPSNN